MGNLNQILANLGITPRDLVEDLIGSSFIADFGIISAVSVDQKTVDVQHAIQPVVVGEQQGTTVTKGVEILWPGGGGQLSMKWDLAIGDHVLLVGLKDFVSTVDISFPGQTSNPLHYTQETMKAIPVGKYNSLASVQIVASASGLDFKGPAVNLQSDIVTDPTFWSVLQAMAAIFGLTISSLKGSFH